MPANDVSKYIHLFVDGRGYAGKVEEINPPKLTLKTEDFQGGGMMMPTEITMGMEKLEADFSLISYDADVLALFNVVEGANNTFVFRQALESPDGTVTAVVHTMRGKIKEIDAGSYKPSEKGSLKAMLALKYYKLQHGDRTIHELDAENMIAIVNGRDVFANIRNALAI